MKQLSGRELAGYVKQKQAKEVRRLKAFKIQPELAIISEGDNPVNNLYLKLKQQYGQDIGIRVSVFQTKNALDSKKTILRLNENESVHGIVIQLPLSDTTSTEEIVNLTEPSKDIDGLGKDSQFESATATAILWLLSGYNIELRGKNVVIIGRGKLVGAPLEKMLRSMELSPTVLDEHSSNIKQMIKQADIVISAAGSPGLLKSNIIKPGAVVIDAGTSSEQGGIKGDVDDGVYQRQDITITPAKGGVGPLTVAALFDNLLRAARAKVSP